MTSSFRDDLKARDRLIFPLDVPGAEQALKLARELKEHVGVFKIGLELFVKEGPSIIREVKQVSEDAKIFLDLKFHDIPNTVGGAFRSAASLGADFVTVHCDEGAGPMNAALERAGRAHGTRVLGVTVLTSLNSDDLGRLGFRTEFETDPGLLVLLRARIALDAGCHGIVCSPREASRVRRELGEEFLIITPGIRPEWSLVQGDDQKRITTPYEAILNGSDLLVVGRPIQNAENRTEAARRVLEEIERGVHDRQN